MNEVGINLRVREEVSSVIPRAVEGVSRLEKQMESLMETTMRGANAFQEWSEQVRSVQTAQATNQATRPIGLVDQNGRPYGNAGQNNNQQSPFNVNGQNVFVELVRVQKEMLKSIRDLLAEEKNDNGAPTGGADDGTKKSKFRKEYEDQEQADKRKQSELDKAELRKLSRGAKSARGALSSWASGDAVGALGNLADGATDGMIEKFGGLGTAAKGGIIAGVVAGASLMGLNALTSQYQKSMRPIMENTAMLGMVGDPKLNSSWMRQNMGDMSAMGGAYGYALDESLGVQRAYANAAGKGYGADSLNSTFAYARGFGVSPNELARFQGLGSRFGQSNGLSYVAGGLGASGMSSSQFQEYLNGTMEVFEEGLSKGVVRGFGDITKTQNMLAGFGDTWKGQYGSQRFMALNDSITSATNLANEGDVLKYRAALSMSKGGDYIDVMKRLEGGFNSDMFGAIGDQVKSYTGGNKANSIEMYRQLYGVNYTQAEEMVKAFDSGDYKKAQAVMQDAKSQDSPEMKLLAAQEKMLNAIREIGAAILPAKTAIVETIASVPSEIAKLFGVDTISLKDKELSNSVQLQKDLKVFDAIQDSERYPYKERLKTKMEIAEGNQFSDPLEYKAGKRIAAFMSRNQDFAQQNYLEDAGFMRMLSTNASMNEIANKAYQIEQDMARQGLINTKISNNRDVRNKLFYRADDTGGSNNMTYQMVEDALKNKNASGLDARLGNMSQNTFNKLIDNGSYYGLYGDAMKAMGSGSDGGATITAKEMNDILLRLISKLDETSRRQAQIELNIVAPPAAAPVRTRGK